MGTGITTDLNGNIYIVGHTNGDLNQVDNPDVGNFSAFLVKFN